MADSNFDVIVIGAGPGGYVTAIRAAQLGLKTAVVEREHLGGICLNWGCIPTKALLRSAEVYRNMHHAKEYGLSCEKPSFDLDAVIQRSRGVSKQLSGGVGHLLKKNKVTVITGRSQVRWPEKDRGRRQGQGHLYRQELYHRDWCACACAFRGLKPTARLSGITKRP